MERIAQRLNRENREKVKRIAECMVVSLFEDDKLVGVTGKEYWNEVTEEVTEGLTEDEYVTMVSAISKDGYYIGNVEDAQRLHDEYGIVTFEPMDNGGGTCCVGWSERDQQWYGWAHRGTYGFQIGDVVEEGDITASPGILDEYLEEFPEDDRSLPVGFEAKTNEDAKLMAIAYADSIR